MIRFIAAIDEKRGLATDQGIPWHFEADSKFYIDQTAKGIILMGYGTYVEFTEPMHDRLNYVATSHPSASLLPGFEAVPDVPAFFKAHKGELISNIGGAGLFASTLKFADELVLTQIQADFNCTKFFPAYAEAFELTDRLAPIIENGITLCFEVWSRKS